MKMGFSEFVRFLQVLCMFAASATQQGAAQTAPAMDVQNYAGVTITGSIGTVYSIEYVSDLAHTNDPYAWRCLEFLRLPASPYLWVDRSDPLSEKRYYRASEFAAPTNLVFIPRGTFVMGSPRDEVDRDGWEGKQTSVTISRGFWMGRCEVTQGEYLAVSGTNPSFFNGIRQNWPEPGTQMDFGTDLNRPVEMVSWFDATNFCFRLTDLERSMGRISANSLYRLPTEAEWEYACRAMTSTRFSFGDDPGYTNLSQYAWHSDFSGAPPHPVGQKLPNPWGLYDMHGGVYEWCQDWWSNYYPGGSVIDPQGPVRDGSGYTRVKRSGSFRAIPKLARSANRLDDFPAFGRHYIGFRIVLAPGQP